MSNKILKAALAVSFVVIIGLSFWGFKSDQKNFEISKNLDIFYTLVRELNLFYVDEVKPDKLIKTGIDDMLETMYDTGGIGLAATQVNQFKTLVRPYHGRLRRGCIGIGPREPCNGKLTSPASIFLIISSSLPSYANFILFSNSNEASVL